MRIIRQNHKAFTLAEILITLSIIGVIALITIPALVQDVQDAQFKTAWKKTYADLSQAQKMIFANGNSFRDACVSSDNNCLKNVFKPYLNYIKDCSANNVSNNCFPNSTRCLNGSSCTYSANSGLVLNNGAFVTFSLQDNKCASSHGTIPQYCGFILIDVNGFKGPNVFGKDTYAAEIHKSTIKPTGTPGDGHEGDCIPSKSGYSCSALYLYK